MLRNISNHIVMMHRSAEPKSEFSRATTTRRVGCPGARQADPHFASQPAQFIATSVSTNLSGRRAARIQVRTA